MNKISLFVTLTLFFTGCTLNFQNIDTHGATTDLLDENQTPTITATVPVTPDL